MIEKLKNLADRVLINTALYISTTYVNFFMRDEGLYLSGFCGRVISIGKYKPRYLAASLAWHRLGFVCCTDKGILDLPSQNRNGNMVMSSVKRGIVQ